MTMFEKSKMLKSKFYFEEIGECRGMRDNNFHLHGATYITHNQKSFNCICIAHM